MSIDTETITVIKVLGTYLLGLAGLAICCGVATNLIFKKMNIH